MRLVIKYGGTSISTAKDIQAVAKHINTLSKKHQILVVCSATSGTTDDLIEISESIKKENKRFSANYKENFLGSPEWRPTPSVCHLCPVVPVGFRCNLS